MPSIIEPVEAHPPTDRAQKLVELSDLELVKRIYSTIQKVDRVTDDDSTLSDDLYWVVGEAVERWAPEIELAGRIAGVREQELSDDETEATLERIVGRFAARVQVQACRIDGHRQRENDA